MYRTYIYIYIWTKVISSLKLHPEPRKSEQNVSQFQITSLIPVPDPERQWSVLKQIDQDHSKVNQPFYLSSPITGITLAQNFWVTSCLRPDDLERCLNKQSDTRLHEAAVLTR